MSILILFDWNTRWWLLLLLLLLLSGFYVTPYTLQRRHETTRLYRIVIVIYECRVTQVLLESQFYLLRKRLVWRILHVSTQFKCTHSIQPKHWWGEEKFVHFCRYLIYIECDIKLTKITYKWTGCCFGWDAMVKKWATWTTATTKIKSTVQNNTQSMQLMSFSTTWLLNWLNRDVVVLCI